MANDKQIIYDTIPQQKLYNCENCGALISHLIEDLPYCPPCSRIPEIRESIESYKVKRAKSNQQFLGAFAMIPISILLFRILLGPDYGYKAGAVVGIILIFSGLANQWLGQALQWLGMIVGSLLYLSIVGSLVYLLLKWLLF